MTNFTDAESDIILMGIIYPRCFVHFAHYKEGEYAEKAYR